MTTTDVCAAPAGPAGQPFAFGPRPPRRLPPAAPRSVMGRAVLVGGAAAVLVPGHRPGLGVGVAALAIALGVPLRGRLRSPSGLALAATAVGLVAVSTLRDAGWIVGPCLLAALATWSLLHSGGRGWRPTALGVLAVPLRGLAGLASLAHGAVRLGAGQRLEWAVPAVRGVAVTALLLAVFGGLFATADAAFRELFARLALPTPGPMLVARPLVFLAAAALVGAAALVATAPRRDGAIPAYTGPVLRPVEWVLPLLVLDLLFAAFVSVQLTVLFGGRDHVLSTAGLTYAEYARQGFGQLVVAAVLTLGVVATAARVVPRSPATDRLRTLLLGALCLMTLVVLASASRRLGLYEQEFGFTRLRVSVDAAIAWLGVVLLLVVAAGTRLGARWLPRAVVLSAAAGLLVFALADPDARIAQRNVERFAATGDLDAGYLAGLSADAAPALQALPEPQRSCILRALVPDADPWPAYNLSRERARDVLQGLPPGICQPVRSPRR